MSRPTDQCWNCNNTWCEIIFFLDTNFCPFFSLSLSPSPPPPPIRKYIWVTFTLCICIKHTTIFYTRWIQIPGKHTKQKMYITYNYIFLIKLVVPLVTLHYCKTWLQEHVFISKWRGTGRVKHQISLHSQIWILVVTAVIHVHYKQKQKTLCHSIHKYVYRTGSHFNTYKSYLIKSPISLAKETCKKSVFSFEIIFLIVETYTSWQK
jgi:hypothetical protein